MELEICVSPRLPVLDKADVDNGSVFLPASVYEQLHLSDGDWVQLTFHHRLERKAQVFPIDLLPEVDLLHRHGSYVHMSWLMFFNMTRKHGLLISEKGQTLQVSQSQA
jgi:hypothetical protein